MRADTFQKKLLCMNLGLVPHTCVQLIPPVDVLGQPWIAVTSQVGLPSIAQSS